MNHVVLVVLLFLYIIFIFVCTCVCHFTDLQCYKSKYSIIDSNTDSIDELNIENNK